MSMSYLRSDADKASSFRSETHVYKCPQEDFFFEYLFLDKFVIVIKIE